VESESEKSDQATSHNWQKTLPHPNTGAPRCDNKQKQQTKTTKHTIEFSNNTPGTSARPRNQPAAESRVLVVRTVGTLRSPKTFPEMPPRSADEPRRDDLSKLRQALTRVKSPGHQTSLTFVTASQHVPRRRYSAYRDAIPATGRTGSGPRSPPSPHCPPGRC